MGSLIVSVVRSTINMIKSVLFTCLVAAASADADAAYLGYGYPYAYGYAAHVPFGSSTGLDPITQGLDPVTQGAVPYYGLGYAGYHLGKRSADAEPEADAAYLGYGYPYAFGAYGYAAHVPFGSSTGLDPITQGLDPVTQGAVPYYGLGYHYGKRSADAEPKADAAYFGYGYPYAYGAYGYAAHVPFGSSTGLDPITQGLDPVTQGALPYFGYHYGKRSADAEPEADAAYLGYGYPYAYGAYGYAAHVPFGSSTGLDPITQGLDPVTQGYVPYYGLGYAGYHYGK